MERPLTQLLDELGGWPILRPGWDPEKFDWLLLVAQLRLYNNDILISEWVAPDIKNSDQYVIQVRFRIPRSAVMNVACSIILAASVDIVMVIKTLSATWAIDEVYFKVELSSNVSSAIHLKLK